MTGAPPAQTEAPAGERARAAAGFVVVGASVALALGQIVLGGETRFVTDNDMTGGHRLGLLGAGVAGALAAAIAALLLVRRAPAGVDPTARLSGWARLLAPLALAAAVPGLFAMRPWTDTLTLALSLGVFVLAIEPLWRLHFGAYAGMGLEAAGRRLWARLGERLPPLARRHAGLAIVVAAACFYIAYMIFFTLRGHAKFETFNWDLGQLDNEFYNALHGHPFRCTPLIREGNWSELRNHAEFSIFPLLAIYALHPAATTLLVLQCVLLGAAAVPLYRFAARRLSQPIAVLLALAYLVYPPMHGAQLFDFHFQPIAAAFLLGAIDAFDTRRMRLFAVLLALAIGCREDVSMGTAIVALFLVLSGHRAREGAIIALISVVYFVAMRFFIMPAVGSWGFDDMYRQLAPPGERGFVGIVKTLASNPLYTLRTLLTIEKLRYALMILTPLAFLPVRRGLLVASVIPGAILTLLTTGYGPTLDIGYQYGCDFVPYIFPAAALALAAFGGDEGGRIRRRAAGATLVAASIIATAAWGAIPPRANFHSSYGSKSFAPPTPQEKRRLAGLEAAMRLVPRNAVLAASDRELSHVSNRVECWNLAVGVDGADYAIYTKIDPIDPDREVVAKALASGWISVYDTPEIGLLKRPGAPVIKN
jgi:uncharacterized membrane protein